MNFECFKYWFDGFCESIDVVPNEAQWKRIKESIGNIKEFKQYGPVFISPTPVVTLPYTPTWTVTCGSLTSATSSTFIGSPTITNGFSETYSPLKA